MRKEEREALLDAVEKRRKDERLEPSLARQVKNHGLEYENYIRLIADIREIAEREGVDLADAARRLALKEKEG